MTDAAGSPPDPLFDELRALGDLRAWSVIITVFGDSVRPRGGMVPATVLGDIAGRLGIAQPALRVALHRLTRDGWLTRERRGRRSFYALSPGGLAEFDPATRRIYAGAPALAGPWRLALAPPGLAGPAREALEARMRKAGHVPAGPGVFLGHGASQDAAPGLVQMTGALADLPDWFRQALAPAPLVAEYARLEDALARLEATLQRHPARALDAVALRTLVIHHWRRLVLRHADLPARFFPPDWRGEPCRERVLSLHARLSPAAESWLDQALAGAGTGDGAASK